MDDVVAVARKYLDKSLLATSSPQKTAPSRQQPSLRRPRRRSAARTLPTTSPTRLDSRGPLHRRFQRSPASCCGWQLLLRIARLQWASKECLTL